MSTSLLNPEKDRIRGEVTAEAGAVRETERCSGGMPGAERTIYGCGVKVECCQMRMGDYNDADKDQEYVTVRDVRYGKLSRQGVR